MRRRLSSAAIVLALMAAAVTTMVAVPTPPAVDAAGTPPTCPWTNSWQRYCNRYTSTGAMGSIGLVGDSVLLGSADGASNPGLPSMLSAAGWGPINLVATLGMKTRWTSDNNVSGQYWIKRWHDNGFHPDVIAVNLGANHLGSPLSPYCTASNPANCTTQINYVLDHIATYHPNARIWWAKVNQQFGGAYTAGMLGWNAALDLAAASRPNMTVWDWPTALATANPAILMDSARVHPSSGTQYVKRSTLMRDHINWHVGAASYIGPRPTLPAGGDPLGYETIEPSVVYDGSANGGTTTEIDLSSAVPEGTAALDAVLATTVGGTSGFVTVFPCDETRPNTSSLNYTAGIARSAHTIVRITTDRRLCLFRSSTATVRVYLNGYFADTHPLRFSPIAPQRPLDTRQTGKAAALSVAVPSAAAVAATITVTGTSSGGYVTIDSCISPGSPLPVSAYQPNETVAGGIFATQWEDGLVCIQVVPNGGGELPHVILDVTGTFSADGDLLYVPAPATRVLDTRNGIGGWTGRHAAAQVIDAVAAPAGAEAVSGTITMVRPMFRGWLTAFECGEPVPPTSSVNAAAGIVMASSATVGINETNQTLCIRASRHTHTLFDVVGWWVAA